MKEHDLEVDGHRNDVVDNMIDLNGIEIDEIIKQQQQLPERRRSVTWDDELVLVNLPPDDDTRHVASSPPPLILPPDDDVSIVKSTTRARWGRLAVVIVASLLSFSAVAAVGYGLGYAIMSRDKQASPSPVESTTEMTMNMPVVDDQNVLLTHTPTYSPTPSTTAALGIASNDVADDVTSLARLNDDPIHRQMRGRILLRKRNYLHTKRNANADSNERVFGRKISHRPRK